MNQSHTAGRRWLREPRALAGLVACAGVLTSTLPANAQNEPTSPLEATADASPPAPEASPSAEPVPEDPPDVVEGELAEVVVTGFRRSLGVALEKKQRATGQVDAI